ERIRLLNRAKVTLNVARTWHDENSLRFCLAMPNGSLCVSETLQPHVPEYEPGVHYVAAAPDRLAEVARHYLEHEEARRPIVDRARQLMGELTMARSLARVMAEATALARGGDS
ncbi:MAG: glycosyltransferase, partial [Thermoanaerobaculia bacterium]|nr:glycosyltransferase [Thermoanaerobaculia bacterium]